MAKANVHRRLGGFHQQQQWPYTSNACPAPVQAAKIPCDDNTIQEMINMMDMNRDGVIGWDEFEVFMTEEFAAGKQLLSGEYLLPSGLAINFGVMIGKLKRDKLMGDVQVGEGMGRLLRAVGHAGGMSQCTVVRVGLCWCEHVNCRRERDKPTLSTVPHMRLPAGDYAVTSARNA